VRQVVNLAIQDKMRRGENVRHNTCCERFIGIKSSSNDTRLFDKELATLCPIECFSQGSSINSTDFLSMSNLSDGLVVFHGDLQGVHLNALCFC
jgi:hypothetical protein